MGNEWESMLIEYWKEQQKCFSSKTHAKTSRFIKIHDKGNLGYPQISQKVIDLINLISKIFFVKVPDWGEEQT